MHNLFYKTYYYCLNAFANTFAKGIFIQVKCYFIKLNFLNVFPYVYNFRPNFSTLWMPFYANKIKNISKTFSLFNLLMTIYSFLYFSKDNQDHTKPIPIGYEVSTMIFTIVKNKNTA